MIYLKWHSKGNLRMNTIKESVDIKKWEYQQNEDEIRFVSGYMD